MKIYCLVPGNHIGGGVKMPVRLASHLAEHHDVTLLYPIVKHFTTYNILRETSDRSKRKYILGELLRLGQERIPAERRSRKLLEDYKRDRKPRDFRCFLNRKLRGQFVFSADLDSRVQMRRYPLVIHRSMLEDADFIIYQSIWQYHELKNVTPQNVKRIHWSLADYFFCNYDFPNGLNDVMEAYLSDDVVVAPSRITANNLRKYGVNVRSVIHGGIDPLFNPDDRIGNQEEIRILGYLQPAWWIKGAATIIQCFRRLRVNFPSIKLTLFGHQESDIGKNQLICDSFHTGLSSQEVADLYREHHIFVYPSYSDGFPSPPLEAMACGCAVVSSRVGAVPEYAVHGQDALLCEPMDDDALYKHVIRLMEDAELRLKLGQEASKCAQEWKWESCSEGFNLLFSQLS